MKFLLIEFTNADEEDGDADVDELNDAVRDDNDFKRKKFLMMEMMIEVMSRVD